jgi:hypothetical protein
MVYRARAEWKRTWDTKLCDRDGWFFVPSSREGRSVLLKWKRLARGRVDIGLSPLPRTHGRLDFDGLDFSGRVVTVAAPQPVLGVGRQSTDDRIAVDVLEFFDALLLGANVEIVIASLPELPGSRESQVFKISGCPILFPLLEKGGIENLPGLMRHPLFQNLESLSDVTDLWIGNQEMEVFGHQNVAVHTEIELLSSFLKDSQEALFDAVIVEQRSPPITTAGNKMRTAGVVIALEFRGHEIKLQVCAKRVGDGEHA